MCGVIKLIQPNKRKKYETLGSIYYRHGDFFLARHIWNILYAAWGWKCLVYGVGKNGSYATGMGVQCRVDYSVFSDWLGVVLNHKACEKTFRKNARICFVRHSISVKRALAVCVFWSEYAGSRIGHIIGVVLGCHMDGAGVLSTGSSHSIHVNPIYVVVDVRVLYECLYFNDELNL